MVQVAHNPRRLMFSVCLLAPVVLSLSVPAVRAQNLVFANGFASGELCGWSGETCDLPALLSDLESATTTQEYEAAITAALEVTAEAGWLAPEVEDGVSEAATVMATFAADSYDFMSLASAHELALAGLNGPSLAEAITALTLDVQSALANPDADESRRVILMFSASDPIVSPLPLTAESKLTLMGSLLYGQWLLDTFPEDAFSYFEPTKVMVDSATCQLMVRGEEAAAVAQVIQRNTFVIFYRFAMAVVSVAEVVANCGSGGTTEALGVVVDALQNCVADPLVSWIEVEADSACWSGNPDDRTDWLTTAAVGCLAGAFPCAGDWWGFGASSYGVVTAAQNMVNGICTILEHYGPVVDECVDCTDDVFNLDPACGGSFSFSGYAGCFDPVNAIPEVTCTTPSGDITITLPGGVTMDLNWIPAGTFMMGSPADERGRTSYEDLHQVTLTSGYYMGVTEVTQGQWEAVMGTPMPTSCGSYGVGPDYPVYCVSWNDICGGSTGTDCLPDSFVGRVNSHLGDTRFRLPTEAEWERAARAETQTEFSFAAPPDWDLYCGSFPEAEPYMVWCGNDNGQSEPVGSKLPNGYGLHDMHGNVYEWVADWWEFYLGHDPVTDPTGPATGSSRVFRGGYWGIDARFCRSAGRYYNTPSDRDDDFGFRLARSE